MFILIRANIKRSIIIIALNVISEVIIKVILNKIIINIIIAIVLAIANKGFIVKVIKIISLSYKNFKKIIIIFI